jgi:hypothetical protein
MVVRSLLIGTAAQDEEEEYHLNMRPYNATLSEQQDGKGATSSHCSSQLDKSNYENHNENNPIEPPGCRDEEECSSSNLLMDTPQSHTFESVETHHEDFSESPPREKEVQEHTTLRKPLDEEEWTPANSFETLVEETRRKTTTTAAPSSWSHYWILAAYISAFGKCKQVWQRKPLTSVPGPHV